MSDLLRYPGAAATRRELIEAAKAAWQEGRFAPIPGETELAPLPE